MSVLLLVPMGVAEATLQHRAFADSVWLGAQRQANLTAAEIRLGGLRRDAVRPRVPGITLIQVVGRGHRVIASSVEARGMTAMATVWPSARDPELDVRSVGPHHERLRVSAVRVQSTPDSPVVYAGEPANPAPPAISDLLVALQAGVLIGLAVWAAWKITGRTLRPVRSLHAELAAINGDDRVTRVSEPRTRDEIGGLARAINGTLYRLEQARLRTQQTLDQQRQFAADASHELRTPLAGLRAELESAQLFPDDTDLRRTVDGALHDVDRLQVIVSDLLLLARLDADTPPALEKIDLPELVRTEVARRPDLIPVRLDLGDTGRRILVAGLRTQLGRILTNLLDNAQRHAEHEVAVQVRRVGDGVELRVLDDGEGVGEADRERIFERFTRLDTARGRDQGGSGLGLAIARGLAVAHRGGLHAEDRPDGRTGACFALRLPAATADPDEQGQVPSANTLSTTRAEALPSSSGQNRATKAS
jgi:signal transduction histidine kinase